MYRGSSAKELYNRVNCYILSVSNALTLERVICSPRKVATAYRFILKVSIKALCMKPRLDTTNNTFAIIQRAKEWKFRQIFRNFPEIYIYIKTELARLQHVSSRRILITARLFRYIARERSSATAFTLTHIRQLFRQSFIEKEKLTIKTKYLQRYSRLMQNDYSRL